MKKKILLAGLIFIFVIGLVSVVRLSENSGTNIAVTKGEFDNSSSSSGVQSVQYNQSVTVLASDSSVAGVSLQVLSAHNNEKDCWVAYKGKVYDITSFLPRHPGGINKILPHCGSEESFEQAFTKKHRTSKVDMLMKVGVFIGDFDIKGGIKI